MPPAPGEKQGERRTSRDTAIHLDRNEQEHTFEHALFALMGTIYDTDDAADVGLHVRCVDVLHSGDHIRRRFDFDHRWWASGMAWVES